MAEKLMIRYCGEDTEQPFLSAALVGLFPLPRGLMLKAEEHLSTEEAGQELSIMMQDL
jgi:hypothetical protein